VGGGVGGGEGWREGGGGGGGGTGCCGWMRGVGPAEGGLWLRVVGVGLGGLVLGVGGVWGGGGWLVYNPSGYAIHAQYKIHPISQ